MKYNANSLNSKLYRWFYAQSKNALPSNLCPYFWKLVMAWVVLIPYALFCAPSIILNEAFSKGYRNGQVKTGERMFHSVVVYLLIFVLLAMGAAVATLFTTLYKGTFFGEIWFGGVVFWILLIGFGIIEGIKALIEYIKDSRKVYDEDGYRVYPDKKPNLLIEFFKAKYNKYCPKIEWYNQD
jgi:hypothetical protein